jgi:membrane protein DedA with SNARE-associated domain
MMDLLEGAIAKVQPLLTRYGYAALFLAILVEGFGIPAPSQILLMAASIDAAGGKLNMAWVLAFALAAAVLGNAIGYAIGRWGGHALLRRLRVHESRLARIERRFARNGVWVLLIARFFDGLRQLTSIVAGLLEMPWRKFALWSTLGGMLWTGVWGLGIYFLGRRMVFLHLTFKRIEPVVLALTAAAAVSLLVYLLWQRRSRKS